VGWAAVQVSHMAMVPEITPNPHERVKLNSARYAGGIVATLLVLGLAWVAFKFYGITQHAFYVISIGSIGIGDLFTLIFLIGVREPSPFSQDASISENKIPDPKVSTWNWKSWFGVPMFYQVGMVYMCTRIAVNLSQVFMPFYLEYYQNLSQTYPTAIAEVPIVMMVTSFTSTFFLRRINKRFGRQSTYTVGSIFVLIGSVGLFFIPTMMWYLVFVAAVFMGIGTTATLVTSISMEADLVGTKVQSGAFVYGALSFLDKLANGILIEITSRYSKDPEQLRYIETVIPAGSCLIAVIISYTIVEYFRKRKRQRRKKKAVNPISINSDSDGVSVAESQPLIH